MLLGKIRPVVLTLGCVLLMLGSAQSTSPDAYTDLAREALKAAQSATDNPYLEYPNKMFTYTWLSGWQLTGRGIASRDAQDRIEEFVFEVWDGGMSRWRPVNQQVLTFGGHEGPDVVTVSTWSGFSWVPANRITIAYNDGDWIVEEVDQTYAGEAWQNTDRRTYTRDEEDRVISELSETWDTDADVWQPHTRKTHTYNAKTLGQSLVEIYIEGVGWSQTKRHLYTYDGEKELEELQQYWDGAGWADEQRYTTEYSGDMPTARIEEEFFFTDWMFSRRELFESYDSQGRVTEQISQVWSSGAKNPQAWENQSRRLFEFGIPTAIGDNDPQVLPEDFALAQNYPNPFNPATTIRYTLPAQSHVSLDIYNIMGQRVRSLVNRTEVAGTYLITWDGTDDIGRPVATGVYLYRLTTDQASATRKMLFVK